MNPYERSRSRGNSIGHALGTPAGALAALAAVPTTPGFLSFSFLTAGIMAIYGVVNLGAGTRRDRVDDLPPSTRHIFRGAIKSTAIGALFMLSANGTDAVLGYLFSGKPDDKASVMLTVPQIAPDEEKTVCVMPLDAPPPPCP